MTPEELEDKITFVVTDTKNGYVHIGATFCLGKIATLPREATRDDIAEIKSVLARDIVDTIFNDRRKEMSEALYELTKLNSCDVGWQDKARKIMSLARYQ